MILIVIGILFTLQNLNIIDFNWYSLWRLWPVFLVMWGISIIPVKNIIKTVLVLVVLLASVLFILQDTVDWKNDSFDIVYSSNGNSNDDSRSQEFTVPFEDTSKYANLSMDIAASKFVLVDESYDLVDFQKNGSLIDYKYSVKKIDSVTDIDIYIEKNVSYHSKSHNRVDLALNPYPIWDMSFEIGAADANIDLSGIKVSDISIESGAAALKLKLGDDYKKTNVSIETGASSIKVLVPKESYCELEITSVLSGKNIDGFEKVDHGKYITDNYNETENRIYIVVETAVSSYSIVRY